MPIEGVGTGPARALRGAGADLMVTGEAVLVDIPAATLPSRLLGAFIDWAVYFLVMAGLLLGVALTSRGSSDDTVSTLALVAVVVSVLVLPVSVETLTRGRSLGKLLTRLRVVRDDGGPIVFRHAFVRGLVGVVELPLTGGVPAVLASVSNGRGKRLGDLAAGTYVVHEQTGMKLVPPPPPPAYLREWAVRADIAPLPDGLALAIRQFLLRRAALTPEARASWADALLQRVLPLVAPAPPPVHPEDVLSAVLSARSARESARLQHQQALRADLVPPDPLRRPG